MFLSENSTCMENVMLVSLKSTIILPIRSTILFEYEELVGCRCEFAAGLGGVAGFKGCWRVLVRISVQPCFYAEGAEQRYKCELKAPRSETIKTLIFTHPFSLTERCNEVTPLCWQNIRVAQWL